MFVEGLESLTQNCVPAAVKLVEFIGLTYFTIDMLLQTRLFDFSNLRYTALNRLSLITLDSFFNPETQQQIAPLPFLIEYDFPKPEVTSWADLDKAGALAAFAYHWRHAPVTKKVSLPYLIGLLSNQHRFKPTF